MRVAVRPADVIRLSWREVRHRLFEALVIVVGIGLGVGVIVTVVAMFRASIDESLMGRAEFRAVQVFARDIDYQTLFGPNQAPVMPLGPSSDKPVRLTLADLDRVKRAVPEARYGYVANQSEVNLAGQATQKDGAAAGDESSVSVSVNGVPVTGPDQRWRIPITMTTADYLPASDLQMVAGSWLSADDVKRSRRVAVVGQGALPKLFGKDIAPQDAVGRSIILQNVAYTVIGVLRQPPEQTAALKSVSGAALDMVKSSMPDYQVFIPVTAAAESGLGMRMADGTPGVNVLYFSAAPPVTDDKILALTQKLRSYFKTAYGEGVTVTSQVAEARQSQQNQAAIYAMIALFSAAALLIAALNVLNLTLAKVLRRTRWIGLSVALGATRSQVFWQVLTESLLLGLAGGAVGLLLGKAGAVLVSAAIARTSPLGLAIGVDFWTGLMALAAGVLVSVIFGLVPAMQASRIDPAAALRVQ